MGAHDVSVALTVSHVAMARLASRVCLAGDRKLRRALFDDLAKAVGAHLSAIEKVVLPAIYQIPGLKSEVLVGSVALKHELASLLVLDRKSEDFEQALRRFCDSVEAQADKEQQGLLPLLGGALDEEASRYLALEVQACLRSRLGDHPVLDLPLAPQAPPWTVAEEIEEAAVVLSSLLPTAKQEAADNHTSE